MNPSNLRKLRDYSSQKCYHMVAIMLAKMIYAIVPFNVKDDLNTILIGDHNYNDTKNKKHNGYLGFKLFNIIDRDNNTFSQKEIRDKLKDTTVMEQLRTLFEYSQTYLINPMVNDIKDIALKKNKAFYQSFINRQLTLSELDGDKQKGWIIYELIHKLIDQGIVQANYTGMGKKGNKWFTPGKNFNNDFIPGSFIAPLCRHSKLHESCLKILRSMLKGHSNVEIISEYKLDEKFGYKRYMRIDMAIIKDGRLLCCVEADGRQHYEYIPHFHRNGVDDLKEQQKKDSLKDDWVKNKCGVDNIRIKYDLKVKDRIKQLKLKITPLL
jgi:hypothetical protein